MHEGFREAEKIQVALDIEKFKREYGNIIDLIEIEVPVDKKKK
ncbi:MAG: hypothetical protein ABIN20_05440 [candidate division WOR-3 bacterium]